MANLPKPRLRRQGRRSELIAPASAAEQQAPRVEQIQAEGLRWVNIEHPGALERAWLEEHFDFHALALEDGGTSNQRPTTDQSDRHLFIVPQFRIFDHAAGRLGAGELDLFVGPGF